MAQRPAIVVIDDEESIRWVINKTLENDYEVYLYKSGEDSKKGMKEHNTSVCLIDLNLPGMDGLSLMEYIKDNYPHAIPVIMTGQNTMKNTISAIQQGAFDYISKPFDIAEIETVVQKAIRENQRRQSQKNKTVVHSGNEDMIIGESPAVQNIYKAIGKTAATDIRVLITGESGTGKELIARALHENSNRRDKPLIAINCAAIPQELLESELFGHVKGAFTGANENRKGKFELAEGGTLFLDEIGDMPFALQTKLLRVLQEKEFEPLGSDRKIQTDVRIIAATNKNLKEVVKKNEFREDLYYRINVFSIHSPSLRERSGDIPLLIEHFLKKGLQEMLVPGCNISQEAVQILMRYSWPGNVRELENAIKSLMILCSGGTIDVEHLPGHIQPTLKTVPRQSHQFSDILEQQLSQIVPPYCASDQKNLYKEILRQLELPLIRNVLRETHWNQVKAAKILGINRNTLRKKINELGIQKN